MRCQDVSHRNINCSTDRTTDCNIDCNTERNIDGNTDCITDRNTYNTTDFSTNSNTRSLRLPVEQRESGLVKMYEAPRHLRVVGG